MFEQFDSLFHQASALLKFWLTLSLVSASLCACTAVPSAIADSPRSGRPFANNGVAMTPLEVQPEEWAQILEIKRWKFGVKAVTDQRLDYRLEVRQPGRETISLAVFSLNTTEDFNSDLLIALYPIGDDFYHADELRIYISADGTATARTFDNPFQGWAASKPNQPAKPLESSSYELMIFSQDGDFFDADNAQVILSITSDEQS